MRYIVIYLNYATGKNEFKSFEYLNDAEEFKERHSTAYPALYMDRKDVRTEERQRAADIAVKVAQSHSKGGFNELGFNIAQAIIGDSK